MSGLIKSAVTIRRCTKEVSVGDIARSFKELAGWWAITYKATSSCSIKAIEKELQQYILWESAGGRKLRITEIFDVKQERPLPEGTYLSYAMPIIAELLFNQTSLDNPDASIEVVMSNKELCTAIGSCNSKLFDKTYLKKDWQYDLPDELPITSKRILKQVVASNHRKNYQIMYDLREKLEKAAVVIWKNSYIYQTAKGKWFLADEEQETQFLTAQSYALTELNCMNISEVFCKDLYTLYQNLSFEYSKEHYGIAVFKPVNRIISTPRIISNYLKRIIKKENPKRNMSQKVLTSLITADIKKYHAIKELYAPATTQEDLSDIPIYADNEAVQSLELGVQMHTLFRY